VQPSVRIKELLKGPLLRSGELDRDTGLVISSAGGDIDVIVTTPPNAEFLQVSPDAEYVFRVYEKFMLRIKDATAVRVLDLTTF
jgi:hypothetical protein